MGFLDSYDTFVGNRCQELTQQNSTFQKLTDTLGVSNVVTGVEDFLSKGVVESLKNSPLRTLAEDVVAQTITDNARRLSQNVMNQIPTKYTKTLTDLRATAFNAVFATMTLQNDMVLYFAGVVAQQVVDAIRDKRKNLYALQNAVRNLHNALLAMAGGGPFFNEYLAKLRQALLNINEANDQLSIVRSAFFSQTVFPTVNFARANELLAEAHLLIMPPVAGPEAESLKQGFLKGVLKGPSFGTQLGMLMSIPKLTMEMLGAYDLYAIKVIKVNVLLLGFESVVQNLKEVTGGKYKDIIIQHLDDSKTFIGDLTESMALQLNGDPAAITEPVNVPFLGGEQLVGSGRVPEVQKKNVTFRLYKPNPTKTSAKAIEWGVKVKLAQGMLQLIDPNALQILSTSNTALREYNIALVALGELDDRKTSLAVLRATDGREQPGDIEGDMITFAFQANQAIVDSALTAQENGKFGEKTVLALGAKLNARLQLSIDQDQDIENILLRYIQNSAGVLDGIKALGDSVFKLMDDLGMDRAADFLKRGAFGDFFAMNGKTATYVGAAAAGLSAMQSLLSSEEQRQCVVSTINKLKVAETSKKLASQRAVTSNFVKQQKQNQTECEDLKRDKSKVDGCSVGFDVTQLRDNPMKSLSGLFRGVFGGDMFDSLEGTGVGGVGSGSGADLGGVVSATGVDPKAAKSLATSASTAAKTAQEAAKTATNATSAAQKELATAINKVEGFQASATDSLEELQRKAGLALESAPDADTGADLADAITTGKVANTSAAQADGLAKSAASTQNVFGKFGV